MTAAVIGSSAGVLATIGAVVLGFLLNQIGQSIASRRTERFTRAETERHQLAERLEGLEETAVRQGQRIAELFGIVGRPASTPYTRREDDLVPPAAGRRGE